MRFRYPADWTMELAPDAFVAGEGCRLDFRPGNWLEYIENADLYFPFLAGEIRYFEDPNLARKNEFWFENGYWYASGSGKPPGEQVDLIKAGDQFILRAEVEITNINFETGAVSGTRPYLLFFIGNAQGQGIFIRTYPDLIEPGLEVILRTIEFINHPLQTIEARPTTAPPSPTPERTRTPVNYLEKYITATPFYGSNGPSAIFQAQQKCPFQFMYPLDWEVSFDPEYIDTEYCVLSFRPGNWLAYIGEAYLDLPIHAGQIIYWETSSHGAGFRFSNEGGDWYVGGDGIDLGQQIPLIKAGDNYILRGEIYYDGYTRESDAYVGLQDLLIFFISNSKGQSISMESVPDEVEEGLELILHTVTFKDVGE